MAQRESDREDLMREAVALVPRISLQIPGEAEPVVLGRRRDGHLSIYFGPDPVYHFDSDGRLRRAFCEGDLFRTESITLARLKRSRSADETTLLRQDLDTASLARFLSEMDARLEHLRDALLGQTATILQEIPEEAAFSDEIPALLQKILESSPRLSPGLKR